MRRGLDWYARDPQAIRMAIKAGSGAVDTRGQRIPMTTAQAAVYSLVLDLIYECGGEFPNNPEDIASHFSDMGKAKARATIAELVDMGKLFIVDGMLHEKRAEIQAKSRRKLSETRAETGRKGGVSSGVSRRASSENNGIAEANASSKREAEIEREKEGSSVVAREGSPEPSLYERVLIAYRRNPADIPSHNWFPHIVEMHLGRWLNLGLSEDEIVTVCAANHQRHGNMPNGPRALDDEMARFAGLKHVEALKPIIPSAPVHRLPTAGDRPRIITSEERRAAMARGREEAS